MKGYTCACGKFHKFDAWALAHLHIALTHKCECGITNTIHAGEVVERERPRKK